MEHIPERFGSKVFNDAAMERYLPGEIYQELKKTVQEGLPLDKKIADSVAEGMKNWALDNGATHYCHWFQPMTGTTAEKHDSFINPIGEGKIALEFRGKELIKGESDASSFPNGGLRSTFEARGYTAWDPTSYAFIKDHTLCIPTAFCSYGGQVLDKKTPLLRSVEALNVQAMRILRLFGNTTATRVETTVGAEQEYFLIDESMYEKRKDLILCGRTLFGAKPPKGQELNDHYFGTIKPRVSLFMEALNEELWKLGIPAKTEHNEAAPSQHELAPVFESANLATDHNQITMAVMKKLAPQFGYACLLHEKPFDGVNGSGKHNNWAISTNEGENLLKPGKKPAENKQFLLFLTAVIAAVDKHQDLLRISAASANNDNRLGGHEAPPAIISMYLGSELCEILDTIEHGDKYDPHGKVVMESGVDVLPRFSQDTTDRNRTSPMAFTGNKFEFRMLGSSASVAETNIIMNTVVADVLCDFADRLEQAENFDEALETLLRETIKTHRRILFNGDNYSEEWVKEAEKRGLLNIPSTNLAIPRLTDEKNVKLFEKHHVFTEQELISRREILLGEYSKVINIEGQTLAEMVRREILPAVMRYTSSLSGSVLLKKQLAIDPEPELGLTTRLSALAKELAEQTEGLEQDLETAKATNDSAKEKADVYRNVVFARMGTIRTIIDKIEPDVDATIWPYPTYTDILFYCD
ncbi:MAG: glutamine synthetase III [Clostridia bacterium]|nr:glutamine synthetase III [Clostridia bacterium]